MRVLLVNGRGFTLTETVVVIALFTILSLSITGMITQIYKYNSNTIEQANEIEQARRGMLTWVRDAREMTFAATGAFPVELLENHRMGFYSDIDQDQSVEYIEYVLSTSTLRKFIYEATGTPPTYSTTTPTRTEILSEFVRNISQSQLTFRYFDENGVLLASPAAMITDVRYITINLVINIDPIRNPGEFMLQGSATPRNLKDNL